jgi:hypothetical protein
MHTKKFRTTQLCHNQIIPASILGLKGRIEAERDVPEADGL